jgi:formate dehydrogenase major subunit
MIMGSNMAECHPVAFRWPMQAKAKGGKIIHVDPRFTRTSAMADIHAPIRAGTDIVFLGALVTYIINHQRWNSDPFFKEFLVNYTNAATLISADYKDPEDLQGMFSGFDASNRRYDPKSWMYQREEKAETKPTGREQTYAETIATMLPAKPKTDPTLQDPNTVFQIMKRHYARYTPEMVEKVCGCPKDKFIQVAETLIENSGRERTSAIVYAVGWTQHTVGVQFIRTAGMVQTLLGNVGRPGAGILALRGHASIQGSTDIPTLYHSWSGYLAAADARRKHDTLRDYILTETPATSYWANTPQFAVSLLKAWFGDAATKENDYGYNSLPKITGDHSHLPTFVLMHKGAIKGFFVIGQNPAVGGQNAEFQRTALEKLEWMVVRDYFETETATFWKRPGVDPTKIGTEVFFLPAAHVAEGQGTFTNTQRLLQQHDKAVDPPDDARTDLWFSYHLGRRLKELYKDSKEARDWPIQNLLWDYIDEKENAEWRIKDEPSATLIMKEINGYTVADKKLVTGFAALKDDGSTACGCWIYSGVFPEEGRNRAASRDAGTRNQNGELENIVTPNWGFAWPANRRIMYSRASADPSGKPWSERKKYTYWDAERDTGQKDADGNPIKGQWVNAFGDGIDFGLTKKPDAQPRENGIGLDAFDGVSPAIMKPDGKFWLFAPTGAVDGPMPTHYEPYESPVKNPVYEQQRNPVAKIWEVAGNPYHEAADAEKYPIVVSTYRLTEHYLSGTMSRWLPWLAELMPELFVEMSPELAQEKSVKNGDWVTVITARGEVEGRALVTRRMRPFVIDGKTVHEIGIPWHWGYQGLASGDVTNDISALVADPNVSIHEGKVFSCNLRAGRRSAPAVQLHQKLLTTHSGSELAISDLQCNDSPGEVCNA